MLLNVSMQGLTRHIALKTTFPLIAQPLYRLSILITMIACLVEGFFHGLLAIIFLAFSNDINLSLVSSRAFTASLLNAGILKNALFKSLPKTLSEIFISSLYLKYKQDRFPLPLPQRLIPFEERVHLPQLLRNQENSFREVLREDLREIDRVRLDHRINAVMHSEMASQDALFSFFSPTRIYQHEWVVDTRDSKRLIQNKLTSLLNHL